MFHRGDGYWGRMGAVRRGQRFRRVHYKADGHVLYS
jgi:hypothetical protein